VTTLRFAAVPEFPRVERLISASAGGANFGLPPELVEAREALGRLTDADPVMPGESVEAARERLLLATIAAMAAGAELPDATPVEAARVRERLHADAVAVARAGREALAGRVVGLAAGHGGEIIAEHLRPALGEVLAEVRQAAAAFAPFATSSDRELLAADTDARAAAVALDRCHDRYSQISAGRDVLWGLGWRPEQDTRNVFGRARNIIALYGDRWTGHLQSGWKPWPDDPRAYMLWLASEAVHAWMPEPGEQDQVYAQHVERLRGNGALVGAVA
jgi:hypothetical protein